MQTSTTSGGCCSEGEPTWAGGAGGTAERVAAAAVATGEEEGADAMSTSSGASSARDKCEGRLGSMVGSAGFGFFGFGAARVRLLVCCLNEARTRTRRLALRGGGEEEEGTVRQRKTGGENTKNRHTGNEKQATCQCSTLGSAGTQYLEGDVVRVSSRVRSPKLVTLSADLRADFCSSAASVDCQQLSGHSIPHILGRLPGLPLQRNVRLVSSLSHCCGRSVVIPLSLLRPIRCDNGTTCFEKSPAPAARRPPLTAPPPP